MAKRSTKKEIEEKKDSVQKSEEEVPKPRVKIPPIEASVFYNSSSDGNITSLKDVTEVRKEVASYLEKSPNNSEIADSFLVLHNLLTTIFDAFETTNEKSKETTKVANFLLKQISNLKEVSDLSVKTLK